MKFELRKIISNRITALFFALIMIASFAYFALMLGTFSGNHLVIDERQTAEYIEKYEKQSASLIRSAERIKSESSDVYTRRLSDRVIAQRVNRRALPTGDNSAVTAFRLTQDNTYISLLLVLFCALISAELFCLELRTGAFRLNFTSKNGRLALYGKKLAALLTASACCAAAFTAVQFLAAVIGFGLTDLNVPVQIETTYSNCAYNIGFLAFVFAVMGTRILSCWFVSFFTACLALLFGNLAAAVSVSGGACALLFALYDITLKTHGGTEIIFSKFGLHNGLLKFSPVCLLNPNGYFISSDYVNVLNFPVTRLVFNIAFTTLVTAALAAVGGYLFARRRGRFS